MYHGNSLKEMAIAFPLTLPCCVGRFFLRQRELCRQGEGERLDRDILRVLRGLLDLNLIEIAGMLELCDEVRNDMDGPRRADQRQRRALPAHGREPERVGARDRIGQSFEKLL